MRKAENASHVHERHSHGHVMFYSWTYFLHVASSIPPFFLLTPFLLSFIIYFFIVSFTSFFVLSSSPFSTFTSPFFTLPLTLHPHSASIFPTLCFLFFLNRLLSLSPFMCLFPVLLTRLPSPNSSQHFINFVPISPPKTCRTLLTVLQSYRKKR